MKKPLQLFGLLALYLGLRLFSFYFGPPTPLTAGTFTNSAATLSVLALTAYFLFRRQMYGWYIVAAELILGGAGGFLALFGLSLRTWLLLISLPIFTTQKIWDKNKNPRS